MSFDVLLQILRPFEGLAAKIASMWLQRYMNTDVGCDVVAFHNSDATGTPGTSQVEVVGTLTTDVAFANMFLSSQVQLKAFLSSIWGSCNLHRASQRWALSQRNLPTDNGIGCQSSAVVLSVVDVDVEWAAVPADDFDGFQCGGRLGLLLGSTFLAVERREISTKDDVYDN